MGRAATRVCGGIGLALFHCGVFRRVASLGRPATKLRVMLEYSIFRVGADSCVDDSEVCNIR